MILKAIIHWSIFPFTENLFDFRNLTSILKFQCHIMMMMMMMNCFCGMVDRRKAVSLISAGTIVRDPHHRESPTRREQGLNLRRT